MSQKKNNRVSKVVVSGVTEAQFDRAMSEYAIASGKGDKLSAQMEVEITKVRAKYEGRLENVASDIVKQLEIIEAYCLENKNELFSKKRSMETLHGTVGFRMGTPMLKLLKGVKWKDVLVKLKGIAPLFVRTKEEVDKDAIIDSRNEQDVVNMLPDLGVFIDQDEHFFVELKKEAEVI